MKYHTRIKSAAVCLLACVWLCGCGKGTSTLLLAGADEEQFGSEEDGGAWSGQAGETESGSPSGTQAEEDMSADGTAQEAESVCVYICGEVVSPGVYVLPEGARICDAVEAAGGMTGSASRTYWNLARVLSDGEMIYVPTVEEAQERGVSEWDAPEDAGGQETSGISADGRVNINAATQEQLMTIPGIGEVRANSIIAYREENGAFGSIEDIVNVSGIKDGLFQQIKDYITVD